MLNIGFDSSALAPVYLRRRRLNALLDSGSTISCISEKVHKQIFPHDYKLKKIDRRFRTAGDTDIIATGITRLKLYIGNRPMTDNFYVLKDLSQDIILGRTIFAKYAAVIDFGRKILTFSRDNAVKLTDTHIITPQETLMVKGKCNHKGYVSGLHGNIISKYVSGLRVLDSVATVSEGSIPILLRNDTERTITVHKGKIIARFYPLTEYDNDYKFEPKDDKPKPAINMLKEDTKPVQMSRQDMQSHLETEYKIKLPDNTQTDNADMINILYDTRNAFMDSTNTLGYNDWVKHVIHMEPNTRPIARQPYRLHPDVKISLQKQIDSLVQQGVLIEGDSMWASPVLAIRKGISKAKKHMQKTNPNQEYRLCIDLRYVNAHCIPCQTHILNIRELLDNIGAAKPKFFTTLDCSNSFFQMALDEKSQDYTAFLFNKKQYKFQRSPQGLNSSPFYFQKLMYRVLDIVGEHDKVFCYIDDVLIVGRDLTEHNRLLRKTLDAIGQANLKLKGLKCSFAQEKVNYLGYELSGQGITIPSKNYEAIKSWPTPTNVSEVRSLLGIINYYRSWIPRRGTLIRPLTGLIRKDKIFKWTEACQSSFEEIKRILCSKPILQYPDFEKEFHLFTDASNTALGAVLTQLSDDNTPLPVAYLGRSCSTQEKIWPTFELEALCVVYAVREFSTYLTGRKFIIHTDNKAITSIFSGKKHLSAKMSRYAMFLADYDFDIVHITGTTNIIADALSRREYTSNTHDDVIHDFPMDLERIEVITRAQQRKIDREMRAEKQIEDQLGDTGIVDREIQTQHTAKHNSLTENKSRENTPDIEQEKQGEHTGETHFAAASTVTNDSDNIEDTDNIVTPKQAKNKVDNALQEDCFLGEGIEQFDPQIIRREQDKDEFCSDLIKFILTNELPQNYERRQRCLKREFDFCIKNNMLQQIWNPLPGQDIIFRILLPKTLQIPFIEHVHHNSLSPHLGTEKCIGILRQRVIFKGLYDKVRDFIGSCDICLKVKPSNINTQKSPGLYSYTNRTFDRTHVDFLGPLPYTQNGARYIAVVIDSCSSYIIAWPTRTLRADTFAMQFFYKVSCVYGPPMCLVSDNASTFRSELWSKVAKSMGTRLQFISPYTPQLNGKAEAAVGRITRCLKTLVHDRPNQWDRFLPQVVYGLNASLHATHNLSPFSIVFGKTPRLAFDIKTSTMEQFPLYQIISDMRESQEYAIKQAIKYSAEEDLRMLKYRPPAGKTRNIVEGSIVFWKKADNVVEGKGKFAFKFFGPYIVTRCFKSTAKLQHLHTGQVHKIPVAISQLKLAARYQNVHAQSTETPGPIFSNNDSYQEFTNEQVRSQ